MFTTSAAPFSDYYGTSGQHQVMLGVPEFVPWWTTWAQPWWDLVSALNQEHFREKRKRDVIAQAVFELEKEAHLMSPHNRSVLGLALNAPKRDTRPLRVRFAAYFERREHEHYLSAIIS